VPVSVASSSPTPSPPSASASPTPSPPSPTPSAPVSSPSPTESPTSGSVAAASTPSPSASPVVKSTPILEPSQAAVVVSAPSYSSPPAVPQSDGQSEGQAQGQSHGSLTVGAPLTEQPSVLQPSDSAPVQFNSPARAVIHLGAGKVVVADVLQTAGGSDVSVVPDVRVASEAPEITTDSNQAISTQTVVDSRQSAVAEPNPRQTTLWLILGFSAIGFAVATFALVRNVRASTKSRRRSFVLVS
jgi:hypothetical protein